MIIFANVGKPSNLAYFMLLYTIISRYLQTFRLIKNDKCLTRKLLCKTMHSAKSAKLCNSLLFLQTFMVKIPLLSSTGKTGNMRTSRHHPNRKKDFVFAKKLLPNYSINSTGTDCCEKRRISFLRTFSQKLRKLHIYFMNSRINNTNQTLRIQDAGLHYPHGRIELLRVLRQETAKIQKTILGESLLDHLDLPRFFTGEFSQGLLLQSEKYIFK